VYNFFLIPAVIGLQFNVSLVVLVVMPLQHWGHLHSLPCMLYHILAVDCWSDMLREQLTWL